MEMHVIDLKSLVSQLKNASQNSKRIIGVDGVSGAGKTAVAKELSSQLNYPVIDAVSFIAKKETKDFKSRIDLIKLKHEVSEKLKQGNVIFESILLLDIMKAIGLKPVISVYTIPSSQNPKRGFWEGILNKPLNQYLEELTADEKKHHRANIWLDKETVKYHWAFHPIIHADFLVEGIRSEGLRTKV